MILSFYSYKGGVGRSQLCANIAAYLCHKKGSKVLLWDWDFEAPGLHYYFGKTNSEMSKKGTLDMFDDFCSMMRTKEAISKEDFNFIPPESIYKLSENENGGKIDLLACTSYTEDFSSKANTFNWYEFYTLLKGKYFIEELKHWIKNNLDYDYIIIDSRTGISEYSGICNLHLPDANVIVMAANEQNFAGCKKITDKILGAEYTKAGNRKSFIIPILSRINVSSSPYYKKWIDKFVFTFHDLLPNLDNEIDQNFSKEVFADIFLPKTLLADDPIYSAGENVLFDSKDQTFPIGSLIYKYASIGDYIYGLNQGDKKSIGILNEIDKKTWLMFAENAKNQNDNLKASIAYERAGNYEMAISLGGSSDSYLQLVNKLIIDGKSDEALSNIDKAIQIDPINGAYYFTKGNILFGMNRFEDASRCFENSINLMSMEPNLTEAKFKLASCYQELKKYEEAILIFKQLIENSEGSIKVASYGKIGICYYLINDFNQSLEYLSKSYELNKEDCKVLSNIGNVYYKKNDYDNSLIFYKKALEVDSKFIEGYHNIIYLLYILKQFEEGFSYVEKALQIAPTNLQILNLQALLLLCNNNADESIEICNLMLNLNPDDKLKGEIYNNIGLCNLVKLNFEQSKEFFNMAIRLNEKKHSLFNLGSLHWIQSNKKESIEYFAESYRNFSDYESFNKVLNEVFSLLRPNSYNDEITEIKNLLLEYLPDIAKKNHNFL